jgi:type II secretory pathway pseudopilin PulG
MTRPRPNRAGAGRPAHTLLEMILVLAVLVVVAAITIPLARTMMADTRLTAASDMVRARLADTRSMAMEQGRPFKMGYLANTGRFQIAPEDAPEWDAVTDEDFDSDDVIRGSLPQDILFGASEDAFTGKGATASPGSSWETIAVFLPIGSARGDACICFGKTGLPPLRVRLRGLTGAVTAEDPFAEDR